MNKPYKTDPAMATPLQWLAKERGVKPPKKPLIDPRRSAMARKKGGMNLKAVVEVLAERGFDPTVELVKMLEEPATLEPDVRARMLTTLMEYVHAKKKSVEITGAEGGPIQIENVSDQVLVQIALGGVEDDEPELIEEVKNTDPDWPFPSKESSHDETSEGADEEVQAESEVPAPSQRGDDEAHEQRNGAAGAA